MANNLYGHTLEKNQGQEINNVSDMELADYMEDNCGTCARCGHREHLNKDLCNNCIEKWG